LSSSEVLSNLAGQRPRPDDQRGGRFNPGCPNIEVTPSKPDRGTIGIKTETRNQRGDVVQSLTATLLVPRRALAMR
jgi:hypothetical protein